jgi:hypothetical protein
MHHRRQTSDYVVLVTGIGQPRADVAGRDRDVGRFLDQIDARCVSGRARCLRARMVFSRADKNRKIPEFDATPFQRANTRTERRLPVETSFVR